MTHTININRPIINNVCIPSNVSNGIEWSTGENKSVKKFESPKKLEVLVESLLFEDVLVLLLDVISKGLVPLSKGPIPSGPPLNLLCVWCSAPVPVLRTRTRAEQEDLLIEWSV